MSIDPIVAAAERLEQAAACQRLFKEALRRYRHDQEDPHRVIVLAVQTLYQNGFDEATVNEALHDTSATHPILGRGNDHDHVVQAQGEPVRLT